MFELEFLVVEGLHFILQCTHPKIEGMVGAKQLLLNFVPGPGIIEDAHLLLLELSVANLKPAICMFDVVINNTGNVFQ